MSTTACCPACGTTFRVAPEQLRASDGWVRCGRCSRVFDTVASVPTASVLPAVSPDDQDPDGGDDAPWGVPAPSQALSHLPSLDLGKDDAAPQPVFVPPAPQPAAEVPLPAHAPAVLKPEPIAKAPDADTPIVVLRQADRPLTDHVDDAARPRVVADAKVARSARARLGVTTASESSTPAPRRARRIAFVVGVALLLFVALLAVRWRDTLCAWAGCGG